MRSPAWLALVFIGLTSAACSDWGWKSETIDLGVGADLHAVYGNSFEGYVAVGESGLVVVWEAYPRRRCEDRHVWTRDIGDRDLRALAAVDGNGNMMVVGDGGTAAVSDDLGNSWTSLDLNVDADLHAITSVSSDVGYQTVILGDDVVLLEQSDGTWTPLPPPDDGGWGDLRAGTTWTQTYFVGLEGVAWTNADPLDPASPWIREQTGTTADFFAVGTGTGSDDVGSTMYVAGSGGTLLTHEYFDSIWERVDTGRTVDFIRYSNGILLTEDGELLQLGRQYGGEFELQPRGAYPGALGLYGRPDDLVVVGVDGLAKHLEYEEPNPW